MDPDHPSTPIPPHSPGVPPLLYWYILGVFSAGSWAATHTERCSEGQERAKGRQVLEQPRWEGPEPKEGLGGDEGQAGAVTKGATATGQMRRPVLH